MVYNGYNKTYYFREFKAIQVFGNKIRNNIINIYVANREQNHLKDLKQNKAIKWFQLKKG